MDGRLKGSANGNRKKERVEEHWLSPDSGLGACLPTFLHQVPAVPKMGDLRVVSGNGAHLVLSLFSHVWNITQVSVF